MATLGSNKANVMAVVVESVEGTPVDPSSSGQYVTLQPDAQLTPSFDLLENEEIRASIGAAKGVQGLERPEASFSHYMKHSGVEGTEPEIHELLKAAFGSASANATERTATTSSTVSLIKLGAGGSDFARGKAVLMKHASSPWEIRPVDSVATNDLVPGFNCDNAPASTTAMGKCVNYTPTNSGHQSLSVWMYRGNAQAKEMMAGGKVTEFSFSASAGEFINGSFSLAGSRYAFNPIRIAAADTKLDFLDEATPRAVTIAEGVYRSPYELAAALQDGMNALGSSNDFTCTFSKSTGKFTFTSNGSIFELLWQSGANTANTVGDKIGFSVVADDASALTYTSDNAQTYVAPHIPAYDTTDPIAAKNQEIFLGDATDNDCFCASTVEFTLTNTQSDVPCICSESGLNSIQITGREAVVRVTALLDRHDADKFNRYATNQDTKFLYNFGPKSGGNWVAGKCGSLYIPTATITSFQLTDLDSVIGLELELRAFVDADGNGEVYLNFL